MANVGGGAAYQKLEVPNDGVSQALQYWGGKESQRVADKKLAEEREGVRKAAADKEVHDKYKIDPTKYNITDAGYDDENQANTHLSRRIMQKNNDLMRSAKELALAGNMGEAQKLYDEAKLNETSFQNEQVLSETHKANYQFIIDNKDSISGYSKGYENFYKAGAGLGKQIKDINEEGQIVHMTELVDDDGNKQTQIVNAKDIKNGNWRPYMQQDVNQDTTDIATNLSKIERKDTNGVRIISGNKWDDGKENGIHTQAATELIQAKLGDVEYMSDMVDKFDLYEQFKLDEDNPPVNYKFSTDQKKIVEDKLLSIVKAKYNETFGNVVDSSLVNAYKKPVGKEKDPVMSKLHQDAIDFENGNYRGVLGRHETEFGEVVNIREAIPSGNTVTLVTDGDPIEISNTGRAFLEFKLRGNPEYKKYTPDMVLDAEAEVYSTQNVAGSDISAIAKDMFDAEGKPKVDDEMFLKILKEKFGITGEDNFTWSGNSLRVNGKNVSTASQAQFEASLKAALGARETIEW
jgi:hypothetical protein